MDVEKLQKVQERMRAVLNEEKPLVSFEDLAKATGLWEVVESGTVDEACAIRVGACEFVQDDETSMTLEVCNQAALQQEENVELWQIHDALEGDAEKDGAEIPVKLTPAQELRVKQPVLN